MGVNLSDVFDEIRAVRGEVSRCDGRIGEMAKSMTAVQGDVETLKLRVQGEDGEGGLCKQVRDMQIERAHAAGLQNGAAKGQTLGMRAGLVVGVLLAGAGARDVVQQIVVAIIGGQ